MEIIMRLKGMSGDNWIGFIINERNEKVMIEGNVKGMKEEI